MRRSSSDLGSGRFCAIATSSTVARQRSRPGSCRSESPPMHLGCRHALPRRFDLPGPGSFRDDVGTDPRSPIIHGMGLARLEVRRGPLRSPSDAVGRRRSIVVRPRRDRIPTPTPTSPLPMGSASPCSTRTSAATARTVAHRRPPTRTRRASPRPHHHRPCRRGLRHQRAARIRSLKLVTVSRASNAKKYSVASGNDG